MKNEVSSIHLMEVKAIHQKFAPRYELKNFRPNFKRLVDHLKAKTGPFTELQQNDEDTSLEPEVVKWYTPGRVSTGYSLLYNLYMEPEGTGIEEMTERELWQSHPAFRCYDFNLFREYNKNMINLTKKHWKIVNQDKQDFEHDKKLMPDKSITLNGEPFWYTHPAKELLRKDLRDELLSSLDPSALRETRPEYKELLHASFAKKFTMKNNACEPSHFGSGFETRMHVRCTTSK